MTPTAKITDSGDCTVYSVYPDKTTQNAVGVFTIFVQFFFPLGLLSYGYARMVIVLHRRVETVSEAHGPEAGGGTSGGGAPPGGAAKETKRNESMAKARSNVIKTLALIAFCFIFCWTWNQVGICSRNS